MSGRLLNTPLKRVVKYKVESMHFFQQILGFLFKHQIVGENYKSFEQKTLHVEPNNKRQNTLNTVQKTMRKKEIDYLYKELLFAESRLSQIAWPFIARDKLH